CGKVVRGYPATSIVDSAEEWRAGLIIVGSPRPQRGGRGIFGRTPPPVVWGAPRLGVNVLATGRRTGGKMRIILATDGSDYSLVAARSLAGRPWPNGSEIRVICVMDTDIAAIDPWYSAGQVLERIREDNARHAENTAAETARLLSETGLSVSKLVVSGVPKWRIVDEAREWEANLIVVGSHGRRGITRLLMGSVSEAVAMHAHCSVEVARAAQT